MQRNRLNTRRLMSWPAIPVALIAAGLLLAGVPEDFEGPTLVQLTRDHAVDGANLASIVVLVAGAAGLVWGAWRHADALVASTVRHPIATVLFVIQLGLGMVLLLLSGVSTTLALWASGSFLTLTALLGLTAMMRQGIP